MSFIVSFANLSVAVSINLLLCLMSAFDYGILDLSLFSIRFGLLANTTVWIIIVVHTFSLDRILIRITFVLLLQKILLISMGNLSSLFQLIARVVVVLTGLICYVFKSLAMLGKVRSCLVRVHVLSVKLVSLILELRMIVLAVLIGS